MNRSFHLRPAAGLVLSLSALSLSAGSLVGCQARDLPTESDLELRYDAADRISSTTERDHSLASVAVDAADQGDVNVTKRALERIGNRNVRNDTAAECAVRLVKAGQRADGNQVAATISDPVRRNATFKRLAESDPGTGTNDPAARGVKNYLGD